MRSTFSPLSCRTFAASAVMPVRPSSRVTAATSSQIVVTTRWASIDAIRDFAGDPIDRAVVDDEARPLLVSFDDRVRHLSVVFEDSLSVRAELGTV